MALWIEQCEGSFKTYFYVGIEGGQENPSDDTFVVWMTTW